MARFGKIGDQYFDDAGDPLISGKLYFYESGTNTNKNTFADVGKETLNTNPVILTAAGRQPDIFFDGSARVILTKSNDSQIEFRDPEGDTSGGIQWSGWNSISIYSAGDIVQASNGEYYRSITNGNQNNDPTTDAASWEKIFLLTDWNTNQTYALDVIVVGSDGNFYQSLQASNTGNDPLSSPTFWFQAGSVNWNSTETYPANANVVGSDGVLYVALVSNTGNDPTTTTGFWKAAASPLASAAASYYSQDNFGAY